MTEKKERKCGECQGFVRVKFISFPNCQDALSLLSLVKINAKSQFDIIKTFDIISTNANEPEPILDKRKPSLNF